jgi:hypothetical protein
MPVTRTLNPLPFHDLEPRRFEDLIRQLAYDFRPWLRLEATGRAGSDEGFDVRGIEPGETKSAVSMTYNANINWRSTNVPKEPNEDSK